MEDIKIVKNLRLLLNFYFSLLYYKTMLSDKKNSEKEELNLPFSF